VELDELLAKVVETFAQLHVSYLITGSVASMAYGEPRLTNDIDVGPRFGRSTFPACWLPFRPIPFLSARMRFEKRSAGRGSSIVFIPAPG
jgi:hypothetical protein